MVESSIDGKAVPESESHPQLEVRKDPLIRPIIFKICGGMVVVSWFLMFFFGAANSSMDGNTKASQATYAIAAVKAAVENCYSEYGRIPLIRGGETRFDSDSPIANLEFFPVLMGKESRQKARDIVNPRDTAFLTIRKGKARKGGLIHGKLEGTYEGLFDPWGRPYRIWLDVDDDGTVKVDKGLVLHARVALRSNGPDGKAGTKDDIKSW